MSKSMLAAFVLGLAMTPHVFAAATSIRPNVVSNDIQGGQPVEKVPIWAAIVLTQKVPSLMACSASFLSTRFVMTARHCVFDRVSKSNVELKDVAIIMPGNFMETIKIEDGYPIAHIYSSYQGDIALVELATPLNYQMRNLPLYHGYRWNPQPLQTSMTSQVPAVIYGNSKRSGGRRNDTLALYWATVQLTGMVDAREGYQGAAYEGVMYSQDEYTQNLDPRKFPPPGLGQPGDSGGTAHVYMQPSLHFPTWLPVAKAIGVYSGGNGDDYEAAALDHNAVQWMGEYVGMIMAPRDGQNYTGGRTIDVDVTPGSRQPIKSIGLVDQGGTVINTCNQFTPVSPNIYRCPLSLPAGQGQEGVYTVRAYRDGDTSYDEVNIEVLSLTSNPTRVVPGDGLSVDKSAVLH